MRFVGLCYTDINKTGICLLQSTEGISFCLLYQQALRERCARYFLIDYFGAMWYNWHITSYSRVVIRNNSY